MSLVDTGGVSGSAGEMTSGPRCTRPRPSSWPGVGAEKVGVRGRVGGHRRLGTS